MLARQYPSWIRILYSDTNTHINEFCLSFRLITRSPKNGAFLVAKHRKWQPLTESTNIFKIRHVYYKLSRVKASVVNDLIKHPALIDTCWPDHSKLSCLQISGIALLRMSSNCLCVYFYKSRLWNVLTYLSHMTSNPVNGKATVDDLLISLPQHVAPSRCKNLSSF